MNHTPGPWKIVEANGEPLKPLYITVAEHGSIAQMRGMKLNGAWSSQTWANARLIAASPDLISALVMAKNWMEVEGDYGKDKWEEHDQNVYDSIMEAINNAINKATS